MCIHNFTQVNKYQLARCILSVIKTEKHRYFYGDYLLVILWYFPVNLNNILYFHSKIVCFLLIMTVKNKVIYCFLIKGNSMYFLRWYTVLDFTVFYCCYLTVFYRNFYDFFLQCRNNNTGHFMHCNKKPNTGHFMHCNCEIVSHNSEILSHYYETER